MQYNPFAAAEIHHISRSQYKAYATFGKPIINGASYVYLPEKDMLVREDIYNNRQFEKKVKPHKMEGK